MRTPLPLRARRSLRPFEPPLLRTNPDIQPEENLDENRDVSRQKGDIRI